MNKIEHLLTCAMEECAEITKAASKAQRFGLDNKYPEDGTTNAEDITTEFCHLVAIIEMLEEAGAIKRENVSKLIDDKKAKVNKFITVAIKKGTLQID